MGEWQREMQTQNLKQGPGSEQSAQPDAGLELTDREIMTWAKVGRLTDWATQAPQHGLYLKHFTWQASASVKHLPPLPPRGRTYFYFTVIPYTLSLPFLCFTGVTAEMQNLVHRRIYPFLLMVVVLMGILSFQVRQFKRLYEHIKNDK